MSRAIIDAIRKISGTNLNNTLYMVPASVLSVDVASRTCTVQTIGGEQSINIEGVQLMASVDDGFLLIPALNSDVIVSYSTYYKPFICQFSKLDKVVIVVGENNVAIEIDNDKILAELNDTKFLLQDGLTQFNDGSFGGLVKVIQLTQKLNNLENLVNDFISKYNSHTHILTLTTGTGTAAPTTTTEPATLTPTQQADIENTKVKHG